LVLFNPVLSLDASENADNARLKKLGRRLGVEPQRLSPAHHVVAGAPPTLILVGSKDFLLAGDRQFVDRMNAAGNRCELDLYDGRTHGFFNFGRGDKEDFLATTESMDRFLASLGYLKGPPQVHEFFAHLATHAAAGAAAK
jgi:acetyl esterase/lipase